MPIAYRVEIAADVQRQRRLERLALLWGCTPEQALERALLERLDAEPEPGIAREGNVIGFPGDAP